MSPGTTTGLGARFAAALAAKDSAALTDLLAPDVDFLGLTPRRTWEAHAPEEVLEVLWTWFGEQDRIEALLAVSAGEPPTAFQVGLIHSLHEVSVMLARLVKEVQGAKGGESK